MSLIQFWGPAADNLLIVGLTGGIASGKSEVANQLKKTGVEVIDADKIAREVVHPGTDVYEQIVSKFGNGIISKNGQMDRGILGKLVFTDPEKRKVLNEIIHPAIFARITEQIGEFASRKSSRDVPAVVIDAALIVDVGASGLFDLVLVVVAKEDFRASRLTCDRNMSEEEARDRIRSQVSDEERIRYADIVIENNGSLDALKTRVSEVRGEIEKNARARYE